MVFLSEVFMIKVEVSMGSSRGIVLDLSTFFRMAYPLDYGPVMARLNSQLDERQSLLFHQPEIVEKFISKFDSPKEVVDFLLENKNDEEVRVISIGDSIYVGINEVAYRFYEE